MINWNCSTYEISRAGLKRISLILCIFFKAKTLLQDDEVEFVDHYRFEVCTNVLVKEETTCYLKLPAFFLTAHAHQHPKINLPKNPNR